MVSNLINIVSIVNYFYHVSMLKNFIDSVNRFLPQLKLGVSTKGLYEYEIFRVVKEDIVEFEKEFLDFLKKIKRRAWQ